MPNNWSKQIGKSTRIKYSVTEKYVNIDISTKLNRTDLLQLKGGKEIVSIGKGVSLNGTKLTIDLVDTIEYMILRSNISNYENNNMVISEIICDLTKPEGCMRKTVDGSLFKEIYPNFKYTTLENGLKNTIKWFEENYENCRK